MVAALHIPVFALPYWSWRLPVQVTGPGATRPSKNRAPTSTRSPVGVPHRPIDHHPAEQAPSLVAKNAHPAGWAAVQRAAASTSRGLRNASLATMVKLAVGRSSSWPFVSVHPDTRLSHQPEWSRRV